jgi:hypothetical protein
MGDRLNEPPGYQAGEMLLISLTLDKYVFGDDWKPPDPGTVEAVRARVLGDFRGADGAEDHFTRELGKLLRALRKPGPAGAPGGGRGA